jgi:DNA primase
MNTKLKRLLEEVLGESGNTDARGNIQFYCPVCNHRKRKLEVNLDKDSESYQKYHCWVCNFRGTKLINLFKIAKASNEQIKRLFDITGVKVQQTAESLSSINFDAKDEKIEDEIITLPKDFISLYKKNKTIEFKNALRFIKNRGFGILDIIRYNIGYCGSGSYRGRIIIPSYNSLGKLNYYTGRDIYPNSNLKYKNPHISKDVVIFELFINWNEPINICEGMFDAMTIKINAIPIMGKTLSQNLLEKIKQYKPKVNIILDNDAQKDAYMLGSMLSNDGVIVNVVELPTGEDPNTLGFHKVWDLINKSKLRDNSDLYKKEILAKLL